MDFISVESDAPATPAGEVATSEHRQIMTDPKHPMHEGFKRNDSRVHDYIDSLYRKAYPPAPAPDGTTLSQEQRDAIDLDVMLRSSFGERYDETMASMHSGAARLFSTPEHVKAFEALAPIISELGPQAELAAIQFLAQLGRITTTL